MLALINLSGSCNNTSTGNITITGGNNGEIINGSSNGCSGGNYTNTSTSSSSSTSGSGQHQHRRRRHRLMELDIMMPPTLKTLQEKLDYLTQHEKDQQ